MMMAPAAPPPPDAEARASFSRSRFVEGSMNDRVSTAPPPPFLGGPAEQAAFESQFYATLTTGPGRAAVTEPGNRTSVQSTASSEASRRGFWDGFRERLRLGRGRSRSGERGGGGGPGEDGAAMRGVMEERKRGLDAARREVSRGRGRAARRPEEGRGKAGEAQQQERPSRDDMLANYHELMKAGFFSAHAIQSSRHAAPASRAHEDKHQVAPPMPTTAPPPVPREGRTTRSGKAPPPPVFSIPYSATRPSTDLPTPYRPSPTTTTTATPTPSPALDACMSFPRPMAQHAPPPPHPRGTKRPAAEEGADDAGGAARKLVKKLRKSASRVGADLRLKTSSHAPSTSASSSTPPSRPGTAASSRSARARRPALHAGLISAPRSFSSSSILTTTSTTPLGPWNGNRPTLPPPVASMPRAKLCKPPARTRSRSRGRSRSRSASPRKAARRLSKRRSRSGSPMKLDAPPAAALHSSSPPTAHEALGSHPPSLGALPRGSMDRGGLGRGSLDGVPSFHFPARTRPALSVVPDANKGIPAVPALPALVVAGGRFKFGVENVVGGGGGERMSVDGEEGGVGKAVGRAGREKGKGERKRDREKERERENSKGAKVEVRGFKWRGHVFR